MFWNRKSEMPFRNLSSLSRIYSIHSPGILEKKYVWLNSDNSKNLFGSHKWHYLHPSYFFSLGLQFFSIWIKENFQKFSFILFQINKRSFIFGIDLQDKISWMYLFEISFKTSLISNCTQFKIVGISDFLYRNILQLYFCWLMT
jgi:hypothetical protein